MEKCSWILTTLGKIVCCVNGDNEASNDIKIYIFNFCLNVRFSKAL